MVTQYTTMLTTNAVPQIRNINNQYYDFSFHIPIVYLQNNVYIVLKNLQQPSPYAQSIAHSKTTISFHSKTLFHATNAPNNEFYVPITIDRTNTRHVLTLYASSSSIKTISCVILLIKFND